MRHYVPREYLRLLEPIGIFTDDTTKHIFWSKEAEAKITEFISRIGKEYSLLIGILPGAGNKIKQWPASRFSEVADYLIEKYNAYILILGSESERKEIDEMIAFVKNKKRQTECSGFSLDEKKALISKLDMTVSVDTGPIFIAEASGVPTIDIAGSIHPNEMAPNDGKFHLIVKSEGEPQIWTMNARMYDYKEARRQIENITVPMVTEKIDELVDKLKNKDNISSRTSIPKG
jgi:ADP-heptose:LPS heptosyltransferase